MTYKERLMLDAHTLGALMRSIVSLDYDCYTQRVAQARINSIMLRYRARSAEECQRKINTRLMRDFGEEMH